MRVGAALGRGVARLGGYATEAARVNLQVAFPDWSDAQREEVLVDSYANLGRTVAEIALLQGPHRSALLDRVELTGTEHVEAAHAHKTCTREVRKPERGSLCVAATVDRPEIRVR